MQAYSSACNEHGVLSLDTFKKAVSARARVFRFQQRPELDFVPIAEAVPETAIVCLQVYCIRFSAEIWRQALGSLTCATLRTLVVARCDLSAVRQDMLATTLGSLNVERLGAFYVHIILHRSGAHACASTASSAE
jgi:hypothetical protein